SFIIGTLPDKGAKLKETNEIIEKLLLKPNIYDDDICVENTHSHLECPLTKKLEELTVLTPRQGARKRSVDLANQQQAIYNIRPVKHKQHHHPLVSAPITSLL
ncbi:hypothetical protein BDF20DRAFT_813849, partial [Mycotypha africana]|uniref:uncharacterized protein n=1 Tax=Mycotypha africana TaxID=64632 RepID=UPI0023013C04